MIHQMMMLLHLEMQLRQQALISYSQTTDPIARLQRLDEVKTCDDIYDVTIIPPHCSFRVCKCVNSRGNTVEAPQRNVLLSDSSSN